MKIADKIPLWWHYAVPLLFIFIFQPIFLWAKYGFFAGGHRIARWSRYGDKPGNLVWPHDLAVGRNSEVFVGEVFDANRVQKFRLGCGVPAPTE